MAAQPGFAVCVNGFVLNPSALCVSGKTRLILYENCRSVWEEEIVFFLLGGGARSRKGKRRILYGWGVGAGSDLYTGWSRVYIMCIVSET